MSELHLALGDIRRIRRQVALNTEFRGCGPATLSFTSVCALAAACVQSRWVDALKDPLVYLRVWVVTAAIAAGVAGIQIALRTRREHSGMSDEMLRMVVEQFLPALFVGAVLTAAVARFAADEVWMLPGLWQLVFALGVFASCRFLPSIMKAAGGWYVMTGTLSLMAGHARALSPWTMGAAFGLGQLLMAGVLWVSAAEVTDGE